MLLSEKPPVSIRSRARIPVSRPSFVAPAVTSRDGRRGRVAHPEVLVPGQLDADRPAQLEGGAGGQRVDDQELAAEPATERGSRDPDARDRQAEQLGHLGSDVERALGGGRDVEGPVGIQPGHRGLWLDVALVDPVGDEPPVDDRVARGQRGIHVAAPVAAPLDHVVRQRLVRGELLGPATDGGMLRLGRRLEVDRLAIEAGAIGTGLDRPVEVDHRGSGVVSTSTSMAPSAAASGVSATTSATGWPAHMISSRASGWWSRSVPSSTIGRSAAVSTATTPGTASASDVSIDTIRAWAGRASTGRPWRRPRTSTSAANSAAPVTLGRPSTRGTDRPMALVRVSMVTFLRRSGCVGRSRGTGTPRPRS
jgi:hypothetical protein